MFNRHIRAYFYICPNTYWYIWIYHEQWDLFHSEELPALKPPASVTMDKDDPDQVELMKNFFKALDENGIGFLHLRNKFPG